MSFVIGQKAAIYRHNYGDGDALIVTIERDTKLYWIASGRKFRKSNGAETGDHGPWDRTASLLPTNDKRVIVALESRRRASAYTKVALAENRLSNERENLANVERLQAALAEYAQVLQ